jgi:cephalosporin hydroxylase
MDKGSFDYIFNVELGGMGAKIAQDPTELWQVVQKLNKIKPDRILEIGVKYGGTSRFWQHLAQDAVVAIDVDLDNIEVNFSDRSLPLFVQGDSTDPDIISRVEEFAPYDFLWIDGGHSYEIAKSDWDNYSPMVRPGGIVGIHDVGAVGTGPELLVQEIKAAGFEVEVFFVSKGTACIYFS